jgi:hypothetical protein
MINTEPRLFRVDEAAHLTGRDPSYVRKLVARGELQPVTRVQTQQKPARYASLLDEHALVEILLKPRKRRSR